MNATKKKVENIFTFFLCFCKPTIYSYLCGLGTKSHDKQKCGEALRIVVSGKTERVIKSLNHKTKKLIKRGNPLALAGG